MRLILFILSTLMVYVIFIASVVVVFNSYINSDPVITLIIKITLSLIIYFIALFTVAKLLRYFNQ